MTKKPNFWKCIIGVAVLAVLFVGTLAVTRAPRTNAANVSTSAIAAKPNPAPLRSAAPPQGITSIENVFEASDGDVVDNPAGGPEDWNNINPPTVGTVPGPQQEISGPAGNALIRTFVNDNPPNDRIFTQGSSKDFLDINTAAQAGPTPSATPGWRNTTGSVPDKDEINQAYAAKYLDPVTGDAILVFGGTRFATNGDANIGFWFFQSPVAVDPATGTFTGFHENGDLLLLSAFTGGGGTSTIRILEWVGSVPGNPGQLDSLANRQARCAGLGGILDPSGDTLCDITGAGTAGVAFVNNANTTSVWPYTPKGKSCGTNCIPVGASFEGGLNLTDLGLAGECFSSFMLETRSSASVDAVLKDFALGTFNTCVDLTLSKTTTDVCEGTATTYTYKVKNTGGVTANFTLTDDNETGPYTDPANIVLGPDDLDVGGDANCMPILGSPTSFSLGPGVERTFVCTRNKVAGTYTNTAQATGTFLGSTQTKIASATAKVFVNPAATAGGDQTVCDTAPHIFSLSGATATVPAGGSIKWTVVSGSATISDDTVLNPTATLNGFGSATLRITVKSPAAQTPQCPDAFDEITLTLSQNPAANAGPDLSACEDTPSHQFTISGSSATVPAGAQITWSGPPEVSFDDVNALHPVVTVSAFGSFTLTMSVNNPVTGTGCVPASDTVKVTLNQNPVIAIEDVACTADGTPQTATIDLTANITAGSGSTNSFSWTGPAGFANPGNVATITTSIPGLYTVTVTATHADGSVSCVGTKSKFVGLCASDPSP